MTNKDRPKWNPPGWPWELELITFVLFLAALFLPFLIGHDGPATATPSQSAMQAGRDNLSTQFGFLLGVITVGVYTLHLAFAASDVNRLTASPVHFLSPAIFGLIAYYRVASVPGVENTAWGFINKSPAQRVLFVLGLLAVTIVLMFFRRQRYMKRFEGIAWDMVVPARYNGSYLKLIFEFRPLLYPPRQYRICSDGVLVVGWHYAMPIAFDDIHSVMRVGGTSMLTSGHYYASNIGEFVRLDLHDLRKDIFISPDNADGFVNCCLPHIARRKSSSNSTQIKHSTLHAASPSQDGV